MLLLRVVCPYCGASLTEGQKVRLDAWAKSLNRDGVVYLSAFFGDQTTETDLDLPDGAMVEYRCPSCEKSLTIQVPCRLCRAPMASLNLESGGVLEFCTRRGCRGHALGGFGDVDQMMSLINSMMQTPHD
jgi:hypothetical protein